MPKHKLTTGSVEEPLALLYRNGGATSSGQIEVPRFSDICLTKHSQDNCDSILDLAKDFERPIRSDKECEDYIELHSLVDKTLRDIRKLAKEDREPFIKILSQISTALEPVTNKLVIISNDLHQRITKWREMVIEGKRRETDRLEAQAEEQRNIAKYTDDPQKARQAKVQAKQLEKEAREVAPKPEKGIDTEEYWEGTITNRLLAAKLPEKIVPQDVDQTELNKHVKALQRAGEKITPNILPGLHLERKTRVRFHR